MVEAKLLCVFKQLACWQKFHLMYTTVQKLLPKIHLNFNYFYRVESHFLSNRKMHRFCLLTCHLRNQTYICTTLCSYCTSVQDSTAERLKYCIIYLASNSLFGIDALFQFYQMNDLALYSLYYHKRNFSIQKLTIVLTFALNVAIMVTLIRTAHKEKSGLDWTKPYTDTSYQH